jgi:hypothetical protein
MSDLLPTYRIASAPRALDYSFEKAGLVLHNQPIPWNADMVLVEARLRLSAATARRPEEFTLHVPGTPPINSDAVCLLVGGSQRYSAVFRIPPPSATQTVAVRWREQELGRLELPVLSRDQFLAGLRLNLPTLAVRIGEESIPCKTFVASQCRGLLASALLTSPTSLVPLVDLDLAVEFREERAGAPQRIAVRLSSSQLAAREALVTVAPMKYPRKTGTWLASWRLGERELARQEVRGISLTQFHRSMRLSSARYVLQQDDGTVRLARALSDGEHRERIGPCFLVCSREAGMAGLCSLRVTAQVSGAVRSPLLWEQDVLVTDGPVIIAPGTLEAVELAQVHGFDLSLRGKSLGVLPIRPAPTATFTSEGGFREPEEFSWTSAADAELDQRLSRLLEERFRAN